MGIRKGILYPLAIYRNKIHHFTDRVVFSNATADFQRLKLKFKNKNHHIIRKYGTIINIFNWNCGFS